jgi:glucokinase
MTLLENPDLTVIGGGLSQIGETLFKHMHAEVLRRTIKPISVDTPILPAKLGSHVDVLAPASEVRQAIR